MRTQLSRGGIRSFGLGRLEDGSANGSRPAIQRRGAEGSVLIIVLWVAFGLVSVTLYFAHSMSLELRASDNRMSSFAADQAIEGAARYVSNVLTRVEGPGWMPNPMTYDYEDVAVGEARFWLIGRGELDLRSSADPVFGLVDEASKLNLNTATLEMLELLPGMTPEFAAAIIDWRDTDQEVTPNGAESETYLRQDPSYPCKDAPFETVGELRLVNGATMELLFGGDANLNGIVEQHEVAGQTTIIFGGSNLGTEFGLFEFVTVHSREPNVREDGTPRVNVNTAQPQELAALLDERLGAPRGTEITGGLPAARQFRSTLEFYVASGMDPEEFDQIQGEITVAEGDFIEGLVNVNTASAAVLACIPGLGVEHAESLVSQRRSRADVEPSIAWVTEVLPPEVMAEAGPFLTGRSFQFSADIAATGNHGRGYRRVLFVFDVSEGDPKIVHRRDLTHLGWALGSGVRNGWLLATEFR